MVTGEKISQLPAIVAPALTDVFPVAQAGVTYKETCTQLAALIATATGFVTYTPPSVANHIAVFSNTSGALTQDVNPAINAGSIQAGLSGTAGSLTSYPATASTGSLTLTSASNAGNYANVITNASTGQATTYTLADPGTASAGFILTSSTAGQQVDLSTSSTSSTLYSLYTTLESTGTTVTTGTLTALEGQVTMVGASGGNQYGLLGNLVATGTLSSSATSAALVGAVNLTGATVNAGTVSAIFAQFNGTAPTQTDVSKTSAIAVQNGTALVLGAAISLTGSSTYLIKNTGAPAYFTAAGTSSGSAGYTSGCNATKVLTINIGSTTYYIPAFAQNT